MESDPNQMSQSPALCRSGCGFYGNAAFDGMCSMCYKEAVKRKQAAPTGAPSSLVSEPISSFVPSSTSSSTASSIVLSPTTSVSSSNVSAITAQVSEAQVEQMEPEPTITSAAVPSVGSPSLPPLAFAVDESASSIVAEAVVSAAVSANFDSSAAPKPAKKKKTRCEQCRANVGVISFPCRCGRIFCGIHRYAKEHNCTFDYKEHGAEEIRKNNPQIIGEKIQKI